MRHQLSPFKDRLRALEKTQQDDGAAAAIETPHPGNLGAHDTLCVGTLKGMSRVYQLGFVDSPQSAWVSRIQHGCRCSSVSSKASKSVLTRPALIVVHSFVTDSELRVRNEVSSQTPVQLLLAKRAVVGSLERVLA